MKDFLIKLIDKREICENTFTFTFDISNIDYHFKAGQYAHFTIIDPVTKDKKGHSRPLSIASSPHHTDTLMIAARKGSSVFIDNLSQLPSGSQIYISKPSGSLYLKDNNKSDVVFIAGGIGITPVRSIIENAIKNKSSQKIYLFYSNRTQSQAAFLDEFKQWSIANKDFKFIPVINDTENKKWDYEFGIIDEELLKKYLNVLSDKIYYIIGPPLMVDFVNNLLREKGIGEEKIFMEKFK